MDLKDELTKFSSPVEIKRWFERRYDIEINRNEPIELSAIRILYCISRELSELAKKQLSLWIWSQNATAQNVLTVGCLLRNRLKNYYKKVKKYRRSSLRGFRSSKSHVAPCQNGNSPQLLHLLKIEVSCQTQQIHVEITLLQSRENSSSIVTSRANGYTHCLIS